MDIDALPACSQGLGSWVLTPIFKNIFSGNSLITCILFSSGGFTIKFHIPFIQSQDSCLSHYPLYNDMKTSLLLLLLFASLDLAL